MRIGKLIKIKLFWPLKSDKVPSILVINYYNRIRIAKDFKIQ